MPPAPRAWHNFYSPFDPVSSKLLNFDHVCPIGNHRVYSGGFVSAHTRYELSASFLRTITDGLFGIPLEPRLRRFEAAKAGARGLAETAGAFLGLILVGLAGVAYSALWALIPAGLVWLVVGLVASAETAQLVGLWAFWIGLGAQVVPVVLGPLGPERLAEFRSWVDLDWKRRALGLALASGDPGRSIQASLMMAELEYKAGRLDSAIDILAPAIQSQDLDTRAQALFKRGSAYWERGDRAKALNDLAEAEELNVPGLGPRITLHIGLLKGQSGDTDGEIEAYNRVVETGHPGACSLALLHLGKHHEDRGDLASATDAFARAEAFANEDDGDAYARTLAAWRLGTIAEAEGRLEDAVDAYNRAEAGGDSRSPGAAIEAALILDRLGRQKEAREALQRAELNGTDDQASQALMESARISAKSGDLEGALEALGRVHAIGQEDHIQASDAYAARVLVEAERLDEAETHARSAATGPNPVYAARGEFWIGVILAERDDLEGALQALGRAEAGDDPMTASAAAFSAGEVHKERAEIELARDAYQRAGEGADPDLVAQARAALAELGKI